jgi:hypothetical protein
MREGLSEFSGVSQKTEMPGSYLISRMLFRGAIATALIMGASPSHAQEPDKISSASQDDEPEVEKEEHVDHRKKLEILNAILAMPSVTFNEFKDGVQIGPHRISVPVPENQPELLKTLKANERVWKVKGKSRLAIFASSIVFTDVSWGADVQELNTTLVAKSRLGMSRESVKRHDLGMTVRLISLLCYGEQDILLRDADGKLTGAVLELQKPAEEKQIENRD